MGNCWGLRYSTSASGHSEHLLLSAFFCHVIVNTCCFLVFFCFFCVIAEGASFSCITRQWLPSVFFVFLWVPSNFWVNIMQNVFENRNLGWWLKGLTLSQFFLWMQGGCLWFSSEWYHSKHLLFSYVSQGIPNAFFFIILYTMPPIFCECLLPYMMLGHLLFSCLN